MSDVYFYSIRADIKLNLPKKLQKLLAKIGTAEGLEPGRMVAVKIHFGEKGNTSYIRPVFAGIAVDYIKAKGHKVFLTDTNTLYRGSREDASSHLETAITNGFAYAVVRAPLIIADGLRAKDDVAVPVPGNHCKEVFIGNAIAQADALVVLSHFKGHEVTGFGGALKNLGMGCASRRGKLSMHSTLSPKIISEKCRGDKLCTLACTFDAITMVDKIAVIDEEKCTGCGECIGVCPHGAVSVRWNGGLRRISEKMAEYATGAVNDKKDRCWYVNFVSQVSPACDCYGHNDAPIVEDIGIFASTDPVAIDQACYDAVKAAKGISGTALGDNIEPNTDKFKAIYPEVEPEAQLIHGEKLGLGVRKYDLIKLG